MKQFDKDVVEYAINECCNCCDVSCPACKAWKMIANGAASKANNKGERRAFGVNGRRKTDIET